MYHTIYFTVYIASYSRKRDVEHMLQFVTLVKWKTTCQHTGGTPVRHSYVALLSMLLTNTLNFRKIVIILLIKLHDASSETIMDSLYRQTTYAYSIVIYNYVFIARDRLYPPGHIDFGLQFVLSARLRVLAQSS